MIGGRIHPTTVFCILSMYVVLSVLLLLLVKCAKARFSFVPSTVPLPISRRYISTARCQSWSLRYRYDSVNPTARGITRAAPIPLLLKPQRHNCRKNQVAPEILSRAVQPSLAFVCKGCQKQPVDHPISPGRISAGVVSAFRCHFQCSSESTGDPHGKEADMS
jgi:hypothetical protein